MAFIITIAIICIFTVIILVAMFKALRKQIIFDATGVNTRLRHITWQHVRAFVVYQHPRQPKRLMYLLYTDLDTYPFAWYEDTRFRLSGRCGNRRQAYRDRAALVHAYIAQQTGLPLRQLKAR